MLHKRLLQQFTQRKAVTKAKPQSSVIPPDLLTAIRAANGGHDVVQGSSEIFLVSATVAKAKAEQLKNPSPGDFISGEGVYVGKWSPRNEQEQKLDMTFNVYAAPEDLPDEAGNRAVFTYTDVIRRLNSMKEWHGIKGKGYASEDDLIKDLKKGRYHGEWIIPTRGILGGKQGAGDHQLLEDYIYKHRKTGAFAGTFIDVARGVDNYSDWYWACSLPLNKSGLLTVGLSMESGSVQWPLMEGRALSCRFVRLVPVT